MKFTQSDLAAVYAHLMTLLAQLAPFSCRVVMIHGYLDDAEYARLYQSANFTSTLRIAKACACR